MRNHDPPSKSFFCLTYISGVPSLHVDSDSKMDGTPRCISSENEYPILVIPKRCTTMETNCDVTENVYIDAKITTPDTDGNETCIYTGFLNIKLIDRYDVNIQHMRSQTGIEDMPIVFTDQERYDDSFDNSHIWSNPRGPFMRNKFIEQPSNVRFSVSHQSNAKHITIQQHNTYITQNVLSFKDAIRYAHHEEMMNTEPEQNNQFNNNIYNSMNFNEGYDTIMSPLQEENQENTTNLNNQSIYTERKEMDNEALKQLMSSDIQSVSKQRKTILYLGPAADRGETIQQIAYTDSSLECSVSPTEIDNEVVIESSESLPPNLKKYQCAKCHQIFDQLSAFREHKRRHAATPRASTHPDRSRSPETMKFVCGDCGRTLKDQHKFEMHVMAHGDPDLECAKCGKVFASKVTLRVHQKIHNRKYRCNFCDRTYAEVTALRTHMAKFHCVFSCDACDYVASKNSELLTHKKIHEVIYTFDQNDSNDTEYCFYEDSGNLLSAEPSRAIDWNCEDFQVRLDTKESSLNVNQKENVDEKDCKAEEEKLKREEENFDKKDENSGQTDDENTDDLIINFHQHDTRDLIENVNKKDENSGQTDDENTDDLIINTHQHDTRDVKENDDKKDENSGQTDDENSDDLIINTHQHDTRDVKENVDKKDENSGQTGDENTDDLIINTHQHDSRDVKENVEKKSENSGQTDNHNTDDVVLNTHQHDTCDVKENVDKKSENSGQTDNDNTNDVVLNTHQHDTCDVKENVDKKSENSGQTDNDNTDDVVINTHQHDTCDVKENVDKKAENSGQADNQNADDVVIKTHQYDTRDVKPVNKDRDDFDESVSQDGEESQITEDSDEDWSQGDEDMSEDDDEEYEMDVNEDDSFVKGTDNNDSVIAKVISSKAFLAAKTKKSNGRFIKVCDACKKCFDRMSDLKRHLIEHVIRRTLAKMPLSQNGILNIECEVCHDYFFHRVDEYKAHLREHAKLTIYRCTFCNKSFSDSSNFSKHKKIHSATYFQCDLCQRKFNSKKMIARHMEYHEENSPVPCPYCSKKFHFKSMLNKHVKGSHTFTYTRFRCRFCLKHFATLKAKWDHEWNSHKARKMIVDCLICGAKYRKYSELKRHCHDQHDFEIPSTKRLLTDAAKKSVIYKKPF